MATKKQIAEQVMRILAGGNLKPDRNMDIREVMLHLDQLRDAKVKFSTLENIKNGNYEVDSDYLSFYESITVQTDAVKGLKYITLPVGVIALHGGIGLYQITPIGDMENAYIITTQGHIALMQGTPALAHELKTYCWRVRNKVYFKNIDDSIAEVTALLAASSKDIAEDADYPVNPNDEAELIERLMQTFGVQKQQPHDEMEDGQK